jgi:hypothetical protein
MTDDTHRSEPESTAIATPASEEQFPTEAFPCPSCGQMLAPTCRVCVSCKRPIDPAAIRRPMLPQPVVEDSAPPLLPVRFPWPIFVVFFCGLMLGAVLSEALIGLPKTELAASAFQLLAAIWVSFDALAKRVPKPLRWGLATLFPTWLIILPWYIARRRQPKAPCPFVEAEAKPAKVALLLILLGVLFYVVFKNAPAPPSKQPDGAKSSLTRI